MTHRFLWSLVAMLCSNTMGMAQELRITEVLWETPAGSPTPPCVQSFQNNLCPPFTDTTAPPWTILSERQNVLYPDGSLSIVDAVDTLVEDSHGVNSVDMDFCLPIDQGLSDVFGNFYARAIGTNTKDAGSGESGGQLRLRIDALPMEGDGARGRWGLFEVCVTGSLQVLASPTANAKAEIHLRRPDNSTIASLSLTASDDEMDSGTFESVFLVKVTNENCSDYPEAICDYFYLDLIVEASAGNELGNGADAFICCGDIGVQPISTTGVTRFSQSGQGYSSLPYGNYYLQPQPRYPAYCCADDDRDHLVDEDPRGNGDEDADGRVDEDRPDDIGRWGCLLCCTTSVLAKLGWTGLTPNSLDEELAVSEGYFGCGALNTWTAAKLARASGASIQRDYNPPDNPRNPAQYAKRYGAILDSHLYNDQPVPIKTNGSTSSGHWVVATAQVKVLGTATYCIVDPASRNANFLNNLPYCNEFWGMRPFSNSAGSAPISESYWSSGAPSSTFSLLATDPSGQSTGTNALGADVAEISSSSIAYAGLEADDDSGLAQDDQQMLEFFAPTDQTYQLQIHAKESATPALLEVTAIDAAGTVQVETFELNMAEGGVRSFAVDYSSNPGSGTEVEPLAGWCAYGQGLSGTSGVPDLSLDANPVLGSTVVITVGNSSGMDTRMVVFWSAVPGSTSLFGGTILVGMDSCCTFSGMLASGGSTLNCQIPDDSSLDGVAVFMQSMQIDSGAPAGVSFSRGVQINLGAR